MKFEELDCRQRRVVEAVLGSDSSTLVLGGPGTGKTTAALWAARAYLDQTEPSARVLFLTFSRSAVAQIMTRSPGVLAGREGRVEILTFHALAYRLLRAFGRYAGYGTAAPVVQSEARTKLLGLDAGRLQYDDLLAGATRLLDRSERIRSLVASRWRLVVCDEVQDSSTDQWRLLRLLGARKLLLLGDQNQMIYSFVDGVSVDQFQSIRQSVNREIELSARSHRDPSGVIPALAEAVRARDFQNEAVVDAIEAGHLTLHFDVDDGRREELVASEVKEARALGSSDVGLFAHSNVAVGQLANILNDRGVDHALIGIPEAHAEGLGAMAMQCAFAVRLVSDAEIRESFALFLTASGRGRYAPPLAKALIGNGVLPPLVDNAVQQIEADLVEAADRTIGALAELVIGSWERLRIQAAFRPWRRAAQHFSRLVAPMANQPVTADSVEALLEIVERNRTEALIDRDYSENGRVRLMTYHQTKGREADTVIHVFLPDDYFGNEREPFEEASRLLNVAISRARQRVVMILPTNPHGLIEPFTALRNPLP